MSDVAEGAALMTRTSVERRYITGCWELLSNEPIAGRYGEVMAELGAVDYDTREVSFRRTHAQRGEADLALHADLETEVELVKFTPGSDPGVLDAYDEKAGVVVEGTGLGHVNTDWIEYLDDLTDDGTEVVMTSQCLEGRVCDRVYDTGRDLLDAGVIEGEDTLPGTATVKLMWALANADDVAEAMGTSLAGEIQDRSVPWT